jgi:membrane-associated phospholipid phosphatase
MGGDERPTTDSTRGTDGTTDSLIDVFGRRGLGRLVLGGVTGLLATGVSGVAGADLGPTSTGGVTNHDGNGGHDEDGDEDERPDDTPSRAERRERAKERREESIRANLEDRPLVPHPTNDDESRFGEAVNYFASYSKGLPHDEYGETDPEAYETLHDALTAENGGDFEAVPQPGVRPLTNPEAAVSYNPVGLDPNDVYGPAPPAFDSAETAAEMVELYWMALLRDVPFRTYGDERPTLVQRAADELDGLSAFDGPSETSTLFRGSVPGVDEGPYVSQFLYKDFERGVQERDQRLRVLDPLLGDYMTDYDVWLGVQNGKIPYDSIDGINRTTPGAPSASDSGLRIGEKRYIATGRDLATYVLENVSHQPYFDAAMILQNSESFGRLPLDDGVPVGPNVPDAFVDYGRSAYQSLVCGIVQAHAHAAWYHKWRLHRRLRPEEFGGRVYQVQEGAMIGDPPAAKRYPIDESLLESAALAETAKQFGTTLLPQAYPEGSPTHPSYPGGHAVSAGSCTTVLKAYFDEDAQIKDPKRPREEYDYTLLESIDADLTVGGELNKLATNMSYARSWAGIHYRSDTTAGLRIGERIATAYLRDQLQQRPADAYGSRGTFSFTTFDGEQVTVTADGVSPDGAFDPPLYGS